MVFRRVIILLGFVTLASVGTAPALAATVDGAAGPVNVPVGYTAKATVFNSFCGSAARVRIGFFNAISGALIEASPATIVPPRTGMSREVLPEVDDEEIVVRARVECMSPGEFAPPPATLQILNPAGAPVVVLEFYEKNNKAAGTR